ncbi:hypothetical protein L208DRAFT_1382281 [Tricholoma matsutake]|nr:hypothetical protein L208DRAFT_1382281 [Tricholoma matsutake 945]
MHTDTTPLFQIRFPEWHQFLDEWINCMEPTQQIREVFETCDCFVGGMDLTLNYINKRYGVKVEDTDRYFNHMALLENIVTSWPPRVQMKEFSDKVNLTKRLDQISEVMNTRRPKMTKLQRGLKKGPPVHHGSPKRLWKWSKVDRYYSLEEISEMHKKEAFTVDNVLNPDSNMFKYREKSKKEFTDFVLETYRMDVGIFVDTSGKAPYFVNKVERTLTTALWVKDRDIPINSLSSTIGQAFHSWIHCTNQYLM